MHELFVSHQARPPGVPGRVRAQRPDRVPPLLCLPGRRFVLDHVRRGPDGPGLARLVAPCRREGPLIFPEPDQGPAEDRLVAAWTPALGAWWARERGRHVAQVMSIWASLERAGEDMTGRPTILDACRSVLMSGRELGLVFLDLEQLARLGAEAWTGPE